MGFFGGFFLGTKDNERISEIAKEKEVAVEVVEQEYKEMLQRISLAKGK